MCNIYLYFTFDPNDSISIWKRIQILGSRKVQVLKAYIITHDCQSDRFNETKSNIERVFPNLFNISCYNFVPLDDPRIHVLREFDLPKKSSNLLTYLELWTYKIGNQPQKNDFQWTFIFHDDVNFIDPSNFSLFDYIDPLNELIYDNEVQKNDGFIYLGICSPLFDNDTQKIIYQHQESRLISEKGCGSCFHATGITVRKARLFWTQLSSYRPNNDEAVDVQMQDYCQRSRQHYFTFGSNFQSPVDPSHFGIAYQDRVRPPFLR